jgi:hypothetical protein
LCQAAGSLENVRLKHGRAKAYYEEYLRELGEFFNANPLDVSSHMDSVESTHRFVANQPAVVPPKFGLIAGDLIQCLRTCLDYLVWELVLAGGGQPNQKHMFPITTSKSNFADQVKRRRLDGIDQAAIVEIEKLQPYNWTGDGASPLFAIDELSVINRHRAVLLTTFMTEVFYDVQPPFPAMRLNFSVGPTPQDMEIKGGLLFYVAFQDGVAAKAEVASTLQKLGSYLATDVFPRFGAFFAAPGTNTP